MNRCLSGPEPEKPLNMAFYIEGKPVHWVYMSSVSLSSPNLCPQKEPHFS